MDSEDKKVLSQYELTKIEDVVNTAKWEIKKGLGYE